MSVSYSVCLPVEEMTEVAEGLYNVAFPPSVYERSSHSTFALACGIISIFYFIHSLTGKDAYSCPFQRQLNNAEIIEQC